MATMFPFYVSGEVVRGFGRGSKELGIPTANFSENVVENLPRHFPLGVYYGWAKVDNGPVYKMVMNVGFCPFYQNRQVSMETHVLHTFDEDFYGATLKVVILGYIRAEKSFNNVDDLIGEIKNDIQVASDNLDQPENTPYKDDKFFSGPVNKL